MARSLLNSYGAAKQEVPADDIYGADNPALSYDPTQGIKTISVGYCNMLPERAKIADAKVLIGRIGGTIRGTEQQIRNPEAVAKGAAPDYGTALVGNFNADVYGDGGEVIAEYAEVGYCYLPGGFQENTIARFADVCDATPADETPKLTFSAFIWAEPSSNPRGYRYVLTSAQRVDKQLQDLRRRMQQEAVMVARIAANMPQLALPSR